MEKNLRKELNKLNIDEILINECIENIIEGLNEKGIEDWLNTIRSLNSSSSKLIIEAIVKETPEILRIIPQSQ